MVSGHCAAAAAAAAAGHRFVRYTRASSSSSSSSLCTVCFSDNPLSTMSCLHQRDQLRPYIDLNIPTFILAIHFHKITHEDIKPAPTQCQCKTPFKRRMDHSGWTVLPSVRPSVRLLDGV